MFYGFARTQARSIITSGEPTTAIRTLPLNLAEEDGDLFAPNLTYGVPQSEIFQLDNITALSNGWLYRNHILLKDSFAAPRDFSRTRRLKALMKRYRLPNQRVPKAVWITDTWSGNYFHWLTDAIPRLSLAKAHDPDLHLILPASYRSVPFVAQSLLPFDLSSTVFIPENKSALIGELAFPAYTAATGNYNEQIIRSVGERYRYAFGTTAKPHRRIYISRSKAPVRKVLNEDEIMPVLIKHGFEILLGENLTFAEQVRLMSECTMLAGPHGAGFVNMLFMQPGSSILEIHPRDTKTNNCYFTLSSALSHRYYYMLANTASMDVESHHDNMVVNPDELDKNLKRMCGTAKDIF